MENIINTWTGKVYVVTEQQRDFFQRLICLTIRRLEEEISQRLAWLRGEEQHPLCTRAQERKREIERMRETFLKNFPDMEEAYSGLVFHNENIHNLQLRLSRLELVEIFSDASRRMALTDEQLKAAPTVEEAMEAIFGDVA
jgi:hypothetical protein